MRAIKATSTWHYRGTAVLATASPVKHRICPATCDQQVSLHEAAVRRQLPAATLTRCGASAAPSPVLWQCRPPHTVEWRHCNQQCQMILAQCSNLQMTVAAVVLAHCVCWVTLDSPAAVARATGSLRTPVSPHSQAAACAHQHKQQRNNIQQATAQEYRNNCSAEIGPCCASAAGAL